MNQKILFIAGILSGLIATTFSAEITPTPRTITPTQGPTMNRNILATAETTNAIHDLGQRCQPSPSDAIV
jgi:hypothetical protein